MYSEIIEDFMSDYSTAEQNNRFAQAYQLLTLLGYEQLETEITELIAKVASTEVQQVVDNIIGYIDSQLDNAVRSFGIRTSDEATYIFKIKLLELLLDLDDQEDTESILSILNNDHSAEERLAELFEHLSENDAGEYLEYIDSVEESLLTRLIENYTRNIHPVMVESDKMDETLMATKISIFKAYRAYCHDDCGPLKPILDNGFPFFMPFSVYLPLTQGNTEDPELVTPLEEVAKSIVLAAIITDEDEKPDVIIHNHLDFLDEHPSKALKIEGLCRQIVQDFTNYLNTQNQETK